MSSGLLGAGIAAQPIPTDQNQIPRQDPALAEAAALQIGSASLSSYGKLPNPQAVFEAINTGATSSVTALAQAGNPLYEAELAGTPAGAQVSSTVPYGAVPAKISDPNQSLWNFDWNLYWSQMHNVLDQEQNASWRSFGQLPVQNFAWLQGVRSSDPQSVKKWQKYLQTSGWYGYQDKTNHISGVWDSLTESAMQGFMVSRAMPDALYSTDPTTQNNATMFLQGLGFDVASFHTRLRDPTVQAQVAQQWAGAQGPDQSKNPISALQQYANQYGEAALPQSYQAIIHPSFIDNVRNLLLAFPVLGLLNDIPGVSGVYHGAVNLLTGNLDLQHVLDDPRMHQAQQIKQQAQALDKLSPDEVTNMKPLFDQIQQDSGFLGFMDNWDHDRNAFLLSIGYLFKEAFSGGKWENPFDPMSQANLWAQAHADNMAATIFGDQWAQDNPVFAGMLNFAVNTADDPLSYMNIVGDLQSVQKLRNIRTLSRTIKDPEALHGFNDLLGNTVRERTNSQFFRAARYMAGHGQTYGKADLHSLFGVGHSGTMANKQADLIDRIMQEPDDAKAYDLFLGGDEQSMGFSHLVNSGRTLYNTRAYWKELAQVKETYKLGKMRVMGGLAESQHFDLIGHPEESLQNFRNLAVLSGMAPEQATPLLDAYYEAARRDPNRVLQRVDELETAILQSYYKTHNVTPDVLETHAHSVSGGRRLVTGETGVARQATTVFAPEPTARTGEAAMETSRGPKSMDEVTRAEQSRQLARLNQELQHAKQMQAPEDVIALINGQINAISRPVPQLVTQLADSYSFPYTPYEMVTAAHPAMRRAESIQSTLKADALMGLWRRWTIARVSSALRLTLGDDVIRPTIMLLGMGHGITAMRYLGGQIGRSLGLVVPGPTRQHVLQQTLRLIGSDPEKLGVLQNFAKLTGELGGRNFVPMIPGQPGYARALSRVIDHHFRRDPLVQAWLKGFRRDNPLASRDALAQFVRESDDPKVQAWLEAQGGSPFYTRALAGPHAAEEGAGVAASEADEQIFNAVMDRFHGYASKVFADPKMRRMAQRGADQGMIDEMVKNLSFAEGSTLPTVSFRQDTPWTQNVITQQLNRFPAAVFEHITGPMVNNARANGFMVVKNLYDKQIRKYYQDHPRASAPGWENEVDQEATSRAIDWIRNNTYQGGRSVLGGSVRNIFPFYGAAINMDRFFWRQAMAKPAIGVAALEAAASSQRAQTGSSQQQGLTAFEGMLAHLGFGGGEGVVFNPLHAFFLTTDGIGSFMPGTGPLFAPVWSLVKGNHDLATILSEIPGFATQIDYASGQAQPEFPWLGDLISGAFMAATGKELSVPYLTPSHERQDQLVIEKVQQWTRNKQGSGVNGTVTDADQEKIREEVGRDMALQGALQYTVPMTPQVRDLAGKRITLAMDQWRQQSTDAGKDQVIAQELGVDPKAWQAALNRTGNTTVAQLVQQNPNSAGALMAYEDSRVSTEDRDAIANQSPWVISSSTSKYQYTQSQVPADLAQWNLMRSLGQVQTLQPFGDRNTFLARINAESQVNTGWLQYDALKNAEFAALSNNGWTQQSPQYAAWKAAYFDPAIIQIQNQNPAWWKQFAGGGGTTSAPGLAGITRPLRTLQTWEVIPQHSDYEDGISVLWRNALVLRDQASSAMYALKLGGGSRAEEDMVLTSLQQQLQDLAAGHPAFAAQLAQFRFAQWQDIVNLQADEQLAQYYSGSVPAFGAT